MQDAKVASKWGADPAAPRVTATDPSSPRSHFTH